MIRKILERISFEGTLLRVRSLQVTGLSLREAVPIEAKISCLLIRIFAALTHHLAIVVKTSVCVSAMLCVFV